MKECAGSTLPGFQGLLMLLPGASDFNGDSKGLS